MRKKIKNKASKKVIKQAIKQVYNGHQARGTK